MNDDLVEPNGTPVRKIKGIPFGGVPCKKCGHTEFAVTNGEIDGGRRVSAKHPEGWSHIFDPAQLEPVPEAQLAALKSEPPADMVERAQTILAEACGIPWKSDDTIDLQDCDDVPVHRALKAVTAALEAPQQGEAVGLLEVARRLADYADLNDCDQRGRADDDAIEVPIGDLRELRAFLSRTPTEPEGMAGREIRCPNCDVRFQEVGNVDAHIAALHTRDDLCANTAQKSDQDKGE